MPVSAKPILEEKENKLLQYSSNGFVLGFDNSQYYAATGSRALKVEFVNSNKVQPIGPQAEEVLPLEKVSYNNQWENIDIEYTGKNGSILESTYYLNNTNTQTAKVEDIKLKYNRPISITNNGDLSISFDDGKMTETKPVAWQVISGEREYIDVEFTIYADDSLGFVLGEYDKTIPVIIDPELSWNTFLGGSGTDTVRSIDLDNIGNIYVSGTTNISWGTNIKRAFTGTGYDAYVAKLDSNGNYQWNTFLGGSGSDYGNAIAIDSNGNIYVSGPSSSSWGTTIKRAFTAGDDAFIAKLDSNGVYQWNTFLGGNGSETCEGIALDSDGNIYITGTSSLSWGTTIKRAFTSGGLFDAYIAKVNSSGTYQWNTFLGSSSDNDYGYAIAVDSSGNIYMAGFATASWGTTIKRSFTGGWDNYLVKLNSSGTYQWNTFLGGSGTEQSCAITVDINGNIYITGYSTIGWGSPIREYYGTGTDAYVSKINSSGVYQWNTFLGGSGSDNGVSISNDSIGNIYVSGNSGATWGSPIREYYGTGTDAYVAKLDSNGNYQWNTFLGGSGSDTGKGLVIDGDENIYTTGTSSLSWGTTIKQEHYGTGTDTFVAKISADVAGFLIESVPSGLSAVLSSDWSTDVSSTVQTDVQNIGISKSSSKIASFDVDFSENRNWSNVTADTNSTKSIFGYTGGNFTNIPGKNSSTYTLYVPRTLVGMRVGFCPNATTLAGVSPLCTNLKYIDSGTSEFIGTDTVSVAVGTGTYSGYWVITGLSVGMGAFDSDGYVIGGAPENIEVLTDISGVPTDITTTAVTGLKTVELKSTTTSNLIAEIDIDFTTDVSLNFVSAGSGTTSAFFHSTVPISTLTNGGSSSYTLYIPKGAGNTVRICPGADSLEEVSSACVGGYDLTAASPNVTVETVGGVEYWKVSGLTGTGGMSMLSGAKDSLSRLEMGVASNHYLEFVTNEGLLLPTDLIFITFPMGFDFGSVDYTDIDLLSMDTQLDIANNPGTNTWGVSVYSLNNMIVLSAPTDGTGYIPAGSIIKVNIGTNATHQGAGVNQIINPLTTGSYSIDLLIINDVGQETATISVPILDSDTVDISGYVTAYINFDIDTNTDNTDCALSTCKLHGGIGAGTGNNYTVDLGELTSAIVNKSQTIANHSDGLSGTINSIYFDLTTNAPSGAVVTVKSLNGGLQGPGTNLISSIADGSDIASNSGKYGFNLTASSTQKYGSIIPNSQCNSLTTFCGPLSTGVKIVFDTNNLPVDSARVRMDLAAAASYTNNPGVYTDTLTFVATGTF
jgi:hypothetical protein